MTELVRIDDEQRAVLEQVRVEPEADIHIERRVVKHPAAA